LIKTETGTTAGKKRNISSTIGHIPITTVQAKPLSLKKGSRWSPHLEKCCLLVSANQSYQRTEEDLKTLIGVKVSHSKLQRMVQGQEWQAVTLCEPIREMSLDGGMVRLRTPSGEPSEWREYKALNINNQVQVAYFKANEELVAWVNAQPIASKCVCLGDGHDGVWNLYAQIATSMQRSEILDWYHLMSNLHKIDGTDAQLAHLRNHLWSGQVTAALCYLNQLICPGTTTFKQYLQKHQSRLINYQARFEQGGTIGSGAVESLVKQIAFRVKLTGAQWKPENVAQVLKHRCAYLNGAFAA
jgi:hypothetical protein